VIATMQTMQVGHDQAVEAAQQFLGDLGIVLTSEPSHVMATDDVVIIRFTTAAEALTTNNVVVVDRTTGNCRFVTVRPEDPDPWPDAKPMASD
jgi:hypothetical protein